MTQRAHTMPSHAQVAPAFAQLLAPYSVRFVRGSVASVEPQETASNGSTAASGARNWTLTSRLRW